MQQVVTWGLKQAGPKKLKHRMCMHTHTSKDCVSHSSSLAQINHVFTSAHLYSQLSHSSSPATRVNKLLQRFADRDLHLERMWRHNCSFCSTNIPLLMLSVFDNCMTQPKTSQSMVLLLRRAPITNTISQGFSNMDIAVIYITPH